MATNLQPSSTESAGEGNLQACLIFAAVALITILLAVLLMPAIAMVNPKRPVERTEKDLYVLKTAVAIFRTDFGPVDPPTTNWIAELTGTDKAVINDRHITYLNLRLEDGVPIDRWRNPFGVVTITNQLNEDSLAFYSPGADGISHTDGNDPDDINTWNAERPWKEFYRKRSNERGSYEFIIMLGIAVALAIGIPLAIVRRRERDQSRKAQSAT